MRKGREQLRDREDEGDDVYTLVGERNRLG